MTMFSRLPLVGACLLALSACTSQPTAQVTPPAITTTAATAATPQGSIQGKASQHTAASLQAAVQNAWVSLPASATGGAAYHGLLSQAPATQARVPVVVFVHGSSGVAPAIKEWQKWLAEQLGIASLAADSMQLPDRMTYKSPIAAADYEKVHGMRSAELAAAVQALPTLAWADSRRVVLAGTSEGAVAVARYRPAPGAVAEKGRMIFSWSCENNYHVQSHGTQIPATLPVLNIMSSTDIYFSQANSWLGNPQAKGHCGTALADNKLSSVVLIPAAPHTLFNLPQARQATEGFLRAQLLSPQPQ